MEKKLIFKSIELQKEIKSQQSNQVPHIIIVEVQRNTSSTENVLHTGSWYSVSDSRRPPLMAK